MRISILGSGSSGNSIFIEENGFRFLIDAGFSGKQIGEKLDKLGVASDTIEAILVTHEHSDHIKGVGILSRKYNIPVYISKKSYKAGVKKLGKISEKNLIFIEDKREKFEIGSGIFIEPFEVKHDAAKTLGFTIKYREKKLAIATDIGYTTNIVVEKFKKSDIVVIESNYDYNMLMNGSYPWELKNRVKGRNGHLSNVETAKFLGKIYSEKLKKVYLAHISKDNNTHLKARNVSVDYLNERNISLDIETVHQDKISKIFEI